jgi:hypothetical protein
MQTEGSGTASTPSWLSIQIKGWFGLVTQKSEVQGSALLAYCTVAVTPAGAEGNAVEPNL